MTRYVALLQGINVGGRRKVPMAELRELLAEQGFDAVRTHLASGNAVFSARSEPAEVVARRLTAALEERFGFAIPTVLRDAEGLRAVVERCPWPADTADPAKLLVYFLDAPAAGKRLLALERREFAPEEWHVSGSEIYAYFPAGAGRGKLGPALVRALPGYVVTSRNWRTVMTLLELLED